MAALALAGCSVDTAFSCQDDLSCQGVGPAAQCEPSGYCSFDDPECGSGRRYGALAGDGLGGHCVDPPGATEDTAVPSDEDDGESGSSDGGVDDTGPASPDWWDCRWAARRRLTIDGPTLGETLSGVPVLIVLNDTRIDTSIMASVGRDLRFIDENGTSLPLDIEKWSSNGLSWVWVLVPQLGPSGTSLTMYYGNLDTTPLEPSVVWADFAGVWHMGFELADATGWSTLDEADAMTTPGQVASAQLYASSSDGIHMVPSPPADSLLADGGTVSAMIRPTGWGSGGLGPIVTRAENEYGNDGWVFQVIGEREALRFGRGFTNNRGSWYTPDQTISLHTWHHVAVVYEDLGVSAEPTFFIDGVVQPLEYSSTPDGRPQGYDDEPLAIGGDPNTSARSFRGSIDEVRMAAVPRSAGWMSVQSASLRDDLVTYGPAESAPCDEPAP